MFLVFAVMATGLLYHFRSLGGLQTAGSAGVEGLKSFGSRVESSTGKPKGATTGDDPDNNSSVEAGPARVSRSADELKQKQTTLKPTQASSQLETSSSTGQPQGNEATPSTSNIKEPDTLAQTAVAGGQSTPASSNLPSSTKPAGAKKPVIEPSDSDDEDKEGVGRLEILEDSTMSKIHWAEHPEHFPVPASSMIQLPTGKPHAIPKIQHDFPAATPEHNSGNKEKLDVIRKAFTFSWTGYRQKAWRQDELSPVSGKYRNPFCAWGATLVDTLDTLWIMDLKDEFEEALEAIKDIDFTTSPRNEIPLFETVIRYLGGLVSAYDISGGAHRILLDKAVQLADILMGSFDTPNRMPMTYYQWKPAFVSQPHRANARVVLAELGSLSLEFTRLAQITKEPRYYDAIARITNELEVWQNHTKLPGLWPLKIDASGCKKSEAESSIINTPVVRGGETQGSNLVSKTSAVNRPSAGKMNTSESNPSDTHHGPAVGAGESILGSPASKAKWSDKLPSTANIDVNARPPKKEIPTMPSQAHENHKRDLEIEPDSTSDRSAVTEGPDCEPQGLASPPYSSAEEFSLGGQADSVYEYLPKEYLLLGGLEPKYRSMYEMAADASKKHLIYRPMIPDEKRSILQAGLVKKNSKSKLNKQSKLQSEGTHLTCFAGGMFALGSKVFDRNEDMTIAKKLTDGCVWAYEATNTGIMPESYLSIACKDAETCAWNETLWKEELDPYGAQREQTRLRYQNQQVLADGVKSVTVLPTKAIDSAIESDPTNTAHRANLAENETPVVKWKDVEEKANKPNAAAASVRAALAISETSHEKTAGSLPASSDSKTPENPFQGSKSVEEEPLAKSAKVKSGAVEPESSTPSDPQNWLLRKRQLGNMGKSSTQTDAALETSGGSSITTNEGEAAFSGATGNKAKKNELLAGKAGAEELLGRKDAPKTPSEDEAHEQSFLKPVGDSVKDTKVAKEKAIAKDEENAGPGSQDEISNDKGRAAKTNSAELASEYSPPSIPTREEFVAARLKDERLPLGMTKITGSRYLLRLVWLL